LGDCDLPFANNLAFFILVSVHSCCLGIDFGYVCWGGWNLASIICSTGVNS
jgi:hypothetical protein